MKKIISTFLLFVIVITSLQINSFAGKYKPSVSNKSSVVSNDKTISKIAFDEAAFSKESFQRTELNLSKYNIKKLLRMSKTEFINLVYEFEKVYDPFDTYKDREELARNNDNTSYEETGWSSGDIKKDKWIETGVHEYVTISSCIMLSKDKGFFYNNTKAVAVTLIISLASLLPDDKEIGAIPFAGHFINPETGKNYAGQKSNTVVSNAQKHYNIAINEAKQGNLLNAYYHLGFSIHYAQDANNPHHSSNITILHKYGNSHRPFEEYTQEHFNQYLEGYDSMSDVFYKSALTTNVSDITFSSALDAHSYIDDVKNVNDTSKWDDVANILIKHAARDTTMILYKFAKESGVKFYENYIF